MFFTTSKEKLNKLFSHIENSKLELIDETTHDYSGLIIAEEDKDEVRLLFFAGETINEYWIPAIIDIPGDAAVSFRLISAITSYLSELDNDELVFYGDKETITIGNGKMKCEIANNLKLMDTSVIDEIDIDINDFLGDMNEKEGEEEYESEELEYYTLMSDFLAAGNYNKAFENAKKLKCGGYSKYKEEIDNCYIECADHGVFDALVFLVNKYTRSDGKVKPDVFEYLVKLNDMGYIGSFRWMADCYYRGIGCEQDLKKAEKLYFEAMLFDYSDYSRDKYMTFHPELKEYAGNNLLKRLIRCYAYDINRQASLARIKIAELIMDGKIEEYEPKTAFVLLKKGIEEDGLSSYRLGKCVLNGFGTDANPVVAKIILETAREDLEWVIEDFEDDLTREYAGADFHEKKDYVEALDETILMIEQAKCEISKMDEYDMYFGYDLEEDEDLIYEEWEEKPVYFIKRMRKTELD